MIVNMRRKIGDKIKNEKSPDDEGEQTELLKMMDKSFNRFLAFEKDNPNLWNYETGGIDYWAMVRTPLFTKYLLSENARLGKKWEKAIRGKKPPPFLLSTRSVKVLSKSKNNL